MIVIIMIVVICVWYYYYYNNNNILILLLCYGYCYGEYLVETTGVAIIWLRLLGLLCFKVIFVLSVFFFFFLAERFARVFFLPSLLLLFVLL